MRPHDERPDNRENLEIPEELRDRLRALSRGLDVPPELDRDVLEAARSRLGRVGWIRARRVVVRIAAAAAMILAAGLAWQGVEIWREAPRAPERLARDAGAGGRRALAEDLDGNGRIDILDAFLLARRLRDESKAPLDWDFTGDGAVDANDVRHLALAAVR